MNYDSTLFPWLNRSRKSKTVAYWLIDISRGTGYDQGFRHGLGTHMVFTHHVNSLVSYNAEDILLGTVVGPRSLPHLAVYLHEAGMDVLVLRHLDKQF